MEGGGWRREAGGGGRGRRVVEDLVLLRLLLLRLEPLVLGLELAAARHLLEEFRQVGGRLGGELRHVTLRARVGGGASGEGRGEGGASDGDDAEEAGRRRRVGLEGVHSDGDSGDEAVG